MLKRYLIDSLSNVNAILVAAPFHLLLLFFFFFFISRVLLSYAMLVMMTVLSDADAMSR